MSNTDRQRQKREKKEQKRKEKVKKKQEISKHKRRQDPFAEYADFLVEYVRNKIVDKWLEQALRPLYKDHDTEINALVEKAYHDGLFVEAEEQFTDDSDHPALYYMLCEPEAGTVISGTKVTVEQTLYELKQAQQKWQDDEDAEKKAKKVTEDNYQVPVDSVVSAEADRNNVE